MEKAQHRIMGIIYWFADSFSCEKKKEFYQKLIKCLKAELLTIKKV
jgi:hypothetical protein